MAKDTEKKWQEHCERWEGSGKTQRAYCEEAGIGYSTFKNKTGKFRVRRRGTFKPVKVIEVTERERQVETKPYCQIIFSGGEEIRISSEAAMSRLKGLMTCLI